jgi:hypothetical protein
MTPSQLLDWSRNPLSQTASVRPKEESMQARYERRKLKNYLPKKIRDESRNFNTAQIRNFVLLSTPKSKWDSFLQSQAKKSISYLKRAKTIKGMIARRALMNWGYKR